MSGTSAFVRGCATVCCVFGDTLRGCRDDRLGVCVCMLGCICAVRGCRVRGVSACLYLHTRVRVSVSLCEHFCVFPCVHDSHPTSHTKSKLLWAKLVPAGLCQVMLGAQNLGLAVTLMKLDHNAHPQLPGAPSPCAQPFPGILLPQTSLHLSQRLSSCLPIFGQVFYAVLTTQHTFNQDD